MPIAFLGIGILEWHGLHNPLGLDGVKADSLAEHFARTLGGVAMPALYWGDHRADIAEVVFDPAVSDWLPVGIENQTAAIAEYMAIPRSVLAAAADRTNSTGGWALFRQLVAHILFETQSLGFEAAVIITGHNPSAAPVSEAIAMYRDDSGSMDVLVLMDKMTDDTGHAGDHAGAFETSVLLALRPELVDIEELDPHPDNLPVGVLGDDPRVAASSEYGWRIVEGLTSRVRAWMMTRKSARSDRDLDKSRREEKP
jgi:creatinine amidohydrolase